jgi:limonene-1,2-epoxide hydrolase
VRARHAAALVLALVAAGCGGASPEEVVRAWSDALNHGLNDDAGALFAPKAVAVSGTGDEIVLTNQADAVAFSASLPCQGKIIALSTDGNRVTATFLLDMRGTFACPAPSTVDTTVFTVEDGKIVRWEQLPD